MELHIQKCQNCGSDKVRNILLREAGEPDRVFVQCHECEQFVASYAIAPLGYYHHGKGYESFLRGIHRSGEFMSGRNFSRLYNQRVEQEEQAFERVVEKLRNRNRQKEE